MIASPMMIHSQGMPPSVVAGVPGAAAAWSGEGLGDRTERHNRERVEPVEHHGPSAHKGLRINVVRKPAFLRPAAGFTLRALFAALAHQSPRRVAIDALDRQIGAAAREGSVIGNWEVKPRSDSEPLGSCGSALD